MCLCIYRYIIQICISVFVCQALIEMAEVLSKEHLSFEVLLSKMAATIMPFTRAQYCTIFIPSDRDKVHYSV